MSFNILKKADMDGGYVVNLLIKKELIVDWVLKIFLLASSKTKLNFIKFKWIS